MRFLGRRAAKGLLGRAAPGIRLPATKLCDHTWSAAQRAAAPRYTKLAGIFLGIAVVTLGVDLAGASSGTVVVVWFVLAIGAQLVMLTGAGRAATVAAQAVQCEHQPPPAPARRAPSRNPRARGGRGKGGKRR
jgi:hypothetical protein